MKKQPILCVTTGSVEINKNWFPGSSRGDGEDEGGFLFTREQAEKFFSYWGRAVENVFHIRSAHKSTLGGFWSRMKGEDDTYVKLDGRNVNMIFRTLDSEPVLKIKPDDIYKLRVDVVILAMDVMVDAVRKATVNEPLGYAKEPEIGLVGMLRGNTIQRMMRSSFDMDRQNRELLEAYGGQWPEKTRTRAGQHHLEHLREIALQRLGFAESLGLLTAGDTDGN